MRRQVCAGILLTVTDETGNTSIDDVRSSHHIPSRRASMKMVADEEKTCRCLKINDQRKISMGPASATAGRRQLTDIIS